MNTSKYELECKYFKNYLVINNKKVMILFKIWMKN